MYAPQPLSQAPVANDLEPMQPGSRCFLRRPLQYPGMPILARGESGIILVVHGSEAIVLFTHGTVTIYDMQCLEPAPGTFSRGFATLTSIPYGVYRKGMMISDAMFPRPDHTQYPPIFVERAVPVEQWYRCFLLRWDQCAGYTWNFSRSMAERRV